MKALCVWLLFALAAVAGPEDSEVWVRHAQQGGPFIDCGSGTVVRSEKGVSWVLTNHHVCPTDGQWIKVNHQGKEYPARRVGWDQNIDLCGLEVQATLPAVEIAKAEPATGAVVRQWGHPHASKAPVHKVGQVVGLKLADRMLLTTNVAEGDSGCGVFDRSGKLVAVCCVCVTFHDTREKYQGCVRLADVRRFLRLDEGK